MLLRLFAKVPMHEIRTVWSDQDASAGTALAQLLWAMRYSRRLRVIPFTGGLDTLPDDAEAAVMTGDKVVSSAPLGFDYQFDLVAMWHRLTGLPFVYAVWAARQIEDVESLSSLLADSRRAGQQQRDQIALRYSLAHGWPLDLAQRELGHGLTYQLNEEHLDSLQEFAELSHDFGLIETAKPIRMAGVRLPAPLEDLEGGFDPAGGP